MEMTKVMSQLIDSYKRDLITIRQGLDLLWLEYPGNEDIGRVMRQVNELIERMS